LSNVIVKNFSEHDFLERYSLLQGNKRILNAGSSSVRFGENCINVDIQTKPNVDIVADIQSLPNDLGEFDAIVCSAVLQYCANPALVADGFMRVLKPGGYLFVDAPWVQPYCPDTPDRLRFSEEALRSIFGRFQIIESGASIRPGSAFAMLGIEIAGSLTSSKYVNFLARKTATIALLPFRSIRTHQPYRTAGAFYLVGQKGC
jgi:SAM-dependent methyltransferase